MLMDGQKTSRKRKRNRRIFKKLPIRKIKSMLWRGMDLVLDLLYPRRCFICEEILDPWEYKKGIHQHCEKLIIPVGNRVCAHCGAPVKGRKEYCIECERIGVHQFTFQQGKALFQYKGEIKETMYRFKYSNMREYAKGFAHEAVTLYGDWIRSCGIDMIIPVPMYPDKEKARGYNQAAVFARELAKELGNPDLAKCRIATRNVDTIPMKTLSKQERYNNLKSAFQISPNVIECGKIALVVDDIYTTGATADAMANSLLMAGIQKVFFLSICIGKGV